MQELPSFDELKRMAMRDPEGLERLRKQHSDYLIESAPAEFKQRLRGLQFQIDTHRKLAGTPNAAMNKLYSMMMGSFQEMRKTLNVATDHPSVRKSRVVSVRPSAQIIPFSR